MSKLIYTKEKLEIAIKKSQCFTDAFKILGAKIGGNTYQRIKILIKEYNIDTSHFQKQGYRGFLTSGFGGKCKKKHYSEILLDNKPRRVNSQVLRRALIESGCPYICNCCGLKPEWNNKPLTLQVDHINGSWKDCKKENLRFLCPNCHTQMPTSHNNDKGKKCGNCNIKISPKSKYCWRCFGFFQIGNKKVKNRPALDTLLIEVEEFGYVKTGKKYGVTDNTIKKWIKKYKKDIEIKNLAS